MNLSALATVIASFSWGDTVQSSITLEGEEFGCQTLTIENQISDLNWGQERPTNVEMGLHRVIVAEQPMEAPDMFLIVASSGWHTDTPHVLLEEDTIAVIEICPMAGA